VILIGALLVGLLAAFLLFNYVRGIEERANNNAKLVDVFVSGSPIPRGTAGEEASRNEDIKQDQVPQKTKPDTAIATLDQINKKVALFNIPKGTVITEGMFVDPATSQISFRQRLKDPDWVALTISVDQVHGVAGFLVPGDQVNMYVGVKLVKTGDDGEAQDAEAGQELILNTQMRVLYQQVQILAVGDQAQLEPGEAQSQAATGEEGGSKSSSNTGLLTLAIPPDASLWIASAQESGSIYLALVAEQYKPRQIVKMPDTVTELPGEDTEKLTPYGPNGPEQK
jgi:Flp pilus assembly protein CpaB